MGSWTQEESDERWFRGIDEEDDQVRSERDDLLDELKGLIGTGTGHTSHWDPTGGHGSGCPECKRAREASSRMHEIVAALSAPKARTDTGGEREPARRTCPDSGRCHHQCADDDVCWRVRNAAPLAAYADGWNISRGGGRTMESSRQWLTDAAGPVSDQMAGAGEDDA